MKKTEQIVIEEKIIYASAENRFAEICGFGRMERDAEKNLLRRFRKIYEEVFSGLTLQAKICALSPRDFTGDRLRIGSREIICPFFAQIAPSDIERLYLYVLTAGSGKTEEAGAENPLDRLCADIWGTALIDCGRDYLQAELRKEAEETAKNKEYGIDISPGFYGMAIDEVKTVAESLQAETIGVKVKGGLLLPEKSCAGIYLILRKKTHIEPACRNCSANRTGCALCSAGGKQDDRK